MKQKMERIGVDTLHFSCITGSTPLALPLGELSPKVTERALTRTLSDFASLSHLSQRERQEGLLTGWCGREA